MDDPVAPEHGQCQVSAMSMGFVTTPGHAVVDELLDRTVGALRVDTAVLLVVDPSDAHLVAIASRGLEEEVLQGFHLPVGAGFSGHIAIERRPIVLDDVTADVVMNPLILSRGVRSMAGVPLVFGSVLVGVLHVGSLTSRHFDGHDVGLLQALGNELAETLYTERAAADRTAARVLQRSLVPATPPPVDGIEIATRFIPAANTALGGDWYDVFPLPDGHVGIVMGDVTGSGLAAAVVMGRLRSTLRAYALESSSPGETLDRLNRKFLHFEPGQMATVLYMTMPPDRRTIAFASAGHPGPIIAHPGGAGRLLDCDPNPPIGFRIDRPTPFITIDLDDSATVACFTDGLFERRDSPLDAQLDKLCAAVHATDPERVCAHVMMTMVGHDVVTDDTALLVLRRTRTN